jgi:regulator of sigma E protease
LPKSFFVLIKVTLFILSLSLLILLHEFGHYITARWFKARVDKFYLFFDFLFPFGNLLNFSLIKKKIGDTTYGLGWFPFGGYVDIVGMTGNPDGNLNDEPQPHEFRAKKPWQRLIILAGGVTVNAILAIIIYGMIAFVWGEEHYPIENIKYGIACDSVGYACGFKDGDKIVSINKQPITYFDKAPYTIQIKGEKTVEVDRNGQIVSLNIDENMIEKAIKNESRLFTMRIPFVIDSVLEATPASKAGLQKGDSLIGVNTDTLLWYDQFVNLFQKKKNQRIDIHFYRKGEAKTIGLTLDADGRMGVMSKAPNHFLKTEVQEYGFGTAVVRGFTRTWESLVNYVNQLPLLFSKVGASKVGGFASIGSIFPSSWDWEAFWSLTAMLSVILAFMNLLPIPVLDGGYILFVLWEMITGRKVSDKVMQKALSVGTFMVLALLILANGNDLWRFVIKPLIGG